MAAPIHMVTVNPKVSDTAAASNEPTTVMTPLTPQLIATCSRFK